MRRQPFRGALAAVLPACFLAASWTWVIGMFLPVLLTERFGVGGWAVFAAFNVLGAASVGLVLAKPGAAASFAAKHARAMGWFSLITVAFQVYAVGWIARRTWGGPAGANLPLGLDTGPAVTVAMGLFVAAWAVFTFLPFRWTVRLAPAVLSVSVGAFAMAALGVWGVPLGTPVPTLPESPAAGLAPLALATPAIAAGFLACPYLDATINRVRRDTPEPAGSLAFALGFGGPFLVMITMTLLYARFWHEHTALPATLLLHVLAQAGFTAGVHTRALWNTGLLHRPAGTKRKRRAVGLVRLFAATFALLLMLPLGNAVQDFGQLRPGMPLARIGYEAFIALYAVAFPAYLWICAAPLTPMADATQRRRTLVFAAVTAAALPPFALGFFEERYWMVALAIAVIAAAPWLAPSDAASRTDRSRRNESAVRL